MVPDDTTHELKPYMHQLTDSTRDCIHWIKTIVEVRQI